MNNFFEKALALRNRYYAQTLKTRLDLLGPTYTLESRDPCTNCNIEALSQLVAVYLKYGENFPDEFSIMLSRHYNESYLLSVLNQIFSDLSIEYTVDSVSCRHFPKSYKFFLRSFTYYITLSK